MSVLSSIMLPSSYFYLLLCIPGFPLLYNEEGLTDFLHYLAANMSKSAPIAILSMQYFYFTIFHRQQMVHNEVTKSYFCNIVHLATICFKLKFHICCMQHMDMAKMEKYVNRREHFHVCLDTVYDLSCRCVSIWMWQTESMWRFI